MPTITFTANPYRINDWIIVHLPKEASARLPSRGQVMIHGTINGTQFNSPLEPDGNGSHWFRIDDDLQRSTGVEAGGTATLAIESTKVWPEPTIPADVRAALDDPEVQKLWNSFTPMARHEWLRWINSTAQQDTRKKRIEVSISKMHRGWRRPCCFNRNMSCVPQVSKSGVLLDPAGAPVS